MLWSEGERRVDVRSTLACNDEFVSEGTSAFEVQGLAELMCAHLGLTPKTPVAKLDARVLDRTPKHPPRDGSTLWNSRKLIAEFGEMSFSAVLRTWRKHRVYPDRLDMHMVFNDPDFESTAADVVGLYTHPPAQAVVFCVDEKSAIRAQDRKDRKLPLSPGRAESHSVEYTRNGTLKLFAALDSSTCEVLGKTARQSPRCEIPVTCDNVSSHKTPRVQAFLAKHRCVQLHFTPTYAS